MKVKYGIDPLNRPPGTPSSYREKFLGEIYDALSGKGFMVERYEDSSGKGLRGHLDVYPLVMVNVYLHHSTSEVEACVFFKRDTELNLVTAASPEIKDKTRQRRFHFPVNGKCLAIELTHDALIMGATLETIHLRQAADERLSKE
ncbi:MAG: hypothetical protein Q8L09_00755 [Candidatus Moranbacteria bacterium]|nr:hypothetical protein [Candidatus Moranbacteria bacterium]